MNRSLLLTSAISLFICTPALAESSEWKIDPAHSAAHFVIRHMMVSNVGGDFAKVSGTVNYDGKNLEKASVSANIDPNSINTRDEHRDGHLKSPDFFDVAKFPEITFKSTKIEPSKDGFKMIGELSMHGITKPVTLNAEPLSPVVKDAKGNLHMGTSATAALNRKDFGISWNKSLDNGGAMLGEDVKITIDVELTQKAQTADSSTKESSKG